MSDPVLEIGWRASDNVEHDKLLARKIAEFAMRTLANRDGFVHGTMLPGAGDDDGV